MKINHIIKEFVTPQATAQDPGLEREKDVDVVFFGQMPRDFTADTVAEALEAVLPREYPPGSSDTANSNVYRVVTEIAKHQGAVVTNKPLSIAQKLVKTFQTYGIKCRIDTPGLEEGWKEKLGAAALAGSMSLGAGSAHGCVTPDGQGGFTGGLKPTPTVTAPTDNKPSTEAPSGFSKEYLQKAADPNRTGRYLISVEKAQELLKQMNEGTSGLPDPNDFDSDWEYQDAMDAYGKPQDNDADYENMVDEPDDWFDESREKVGNMDADAFDAALSRMKKLAGAGPLRTVYDPTKRVYKNVPTAVQPAQQPKKAK